MLPNMLPISPFCLGWPNLKSICTYTQPKIGFCHPRGCYVQTTKYMHINRYFLTFNCISFRSLFSLCHHLYFVHVYLYFLHEYLYFFACYYLYFSPRLCTEHGSVMFELMARWKVWGLVKILISESSPPLVQTEKTV